MALFGFGTVLLTPEDHLSLFRVSVLLMSLTDDVYVSFTSGCFSFFFISEGYHAGYVGFVARRIEVLDCEF